MASCYTYILNALHCLQTYTAADTTVVASCARSVAARARDSSTHVFADTGKPVKVCSKGQRRESSLRGTHHTFPSAFEILQSKTQPTLLAGTLRPHLPCIHYTPQLLRGPHCGICQLRRTALQRQNTGHRIPQKSTSPLSKNSEANCSAVHAPGTSSYIRLPPDAGPHPAQVMNTVARMDRDSGNLLET